jgi:hypothetical protein
VVCVFVLYTRKNSGGKGGGLALPPRKIPYKSNSKKKNAKHISDLLAASLRAAFKQL